MNTHRLDRFTLGLILALIFSLVPGTLNTTKAQPLAQNTAQNAVDCTKTLDALQKLVAACKALGRDQLCYASAPVTGKFSGSSAFNAPGDQVGLDTLKALSGKAVSLPDSWSGSVIRSGVQTTDGSSIGQEMIFILYGDASLEVMEALKADSGAPRVCSAKLKAGANLNGTPGDNNTALKFAKATESLSLIGRTDDGRYVLARLGSTSGWAATSALTADCDPTTLPVVNDKKVQSINLNNLQLTTPITSVGATCRDLPTDGLFIQSPGGLTTTITVNQVPIELKSASAILTAAPNRQLNFTLIDGNATLTAHGEKLAVNARQQTSIALGGTTRLDPIGIPKPPVSTAADQLGKFNTLCTFATALGSELPCGTTVTAPRVVVPPGTGGGTRPPNP
jgi:hypothetical protein